MAVPVEQDLVLIYNTGDVSSVDRQEIWMV